MPEVEVKLLHVEHGALLDTVARSEEPEAKNWLAVIDGREPKLPGGLARRFLPFAPLPYYYLMVDVRQFDVLEWGADFMAEHPRAKGSGRFNVRIRQRTYTVVLDLSETEMRVEIQKTVIQALKKSETLKLTQAPRRHVAYSEDYHEL